MQRKTEAPAPLPAGRYRIRTREPNKLLAAMNGHSLVFPEADCVSDGKWCVFYRDDKQVWGCNALYAAAHFDCEPQGDDRGP
ncbi:hypothetical protein [Cupriavidus nantongensis]|uniref:Uncharacterized protein n=1 Tax=Cupriavidus nantongensis TaxID=1796606 RepID=A0A142JKE1_9BURK|nr:hypothetical protein [Cupriavidus nantongensis]AMR78553.1 hypothetical protein A2G96_12830 [Cupriavidus nantongensis]